MATKLESYQELLDLSPHEIDQIEGGRFSDNTIMMAIDCIKSKDSEELDQLKKLALLKLIWRSPEVEDFYAYDQILFNLIDAVIEQENGKDLLVWALTQVILDAHFGQGFLAFYTYWDYARGFLYQGHGDLFAHFLGTLLVKTNLSDVALRVLIEDAARLGASHLAMALQSLAKKRYGDQWQAVPINELLLQGSDLEANPVIDLEDQAEILEKLSLESLADVDEDIEMGSLTTSLKNAEQITDVPQTEDLLLMVPDMIWYVFRFWEEDRDGCLHLLKALKIMREILPELAILGDLLGEDAKEAFIFESFGKTAGFTFDSIKSYVVNHEYCVYLRTNAAKALMQIPSKAPRHRDQVIKILGEMLSSKETDDADDEIKCSFLVADLLDTDLYDLKPAISRVFQQDRVDPQVVGLESFNGYWSLPALSLPKLPDDKSLFLKCDACGRTRKYPFQAIFFDINSRDHSPRFTPLEFFLDHLVVCPLCGAEESYEVGIQSMFKFIPPEFFDDDNEDSHKFLNESVYVLFSEHLFLEGLSPNLFSKLRRKVIGGGMQALNDLERGEYSRVTGKFQESLSAFRKFQDKHPESQVGTLALAMAEHDYGDRDQATVFYQRCLVLDKGKVLSRLENPRYKTALQGLEALKQGKRSPYLYPINKFHQTLLDKKAKRPRKRKRH